MRVAAVFRGGARRLTGVAAAFSLVILGLPVAALAQAAPPAEDEAPPARDEPDSATGAANGNEITVTATKREQLLLKVPVAVTVVTADTIEKAHIRDIEDISTLVPSLRVVDHQSTAQTAFYIRGFGNGDNNVGVEPSVGVFIDNVYRPRSAAEIGDFFPAITRVEVLRGPQSTLFGKNASAGVINIMTAEPKFHPGGEGEVSYGNDNALIARGFVTGPLSQTVAVSLAAGINRRDGYARNATTGDAINNRNRWFVRGQLLYEPDTQFKLRLIADYSRISELCCAVVNVRASAASAAVGGVVNNPATPFADVTYANFDPTNDIRDYGLSAEADYTLGPLTFTSITSWRKNRAISNSDADFTSADLLGRYSADVAIRTITQEFRVATNIDGPLNFLLGAFYSNEAIGDAGQTIYGRQFRSYANFLITQASADAYSLPALESEFGTLQGNPALYSGQFFAAGQGLDEAYHLTDNDFSIYGQADFKPIRRVTLTAGFDYTRDIKHFATDVVSSDVFSGLNLPALSTLATNAGIAQAIGGLLRVPGGVASPAEVAGFAGNPFTAPYYRLIANAVAARASQLLALRALQFLPPFLNVPNAVEPGRVSDGNLSWTARIAYDPSDHMRLYLNASTGFKASSVNLSSDSRPALSDAAAIVASGLAVVNQTYGTRFAGPEHSMLFEAGLKADWGIATLNFAAFREIITGFQTNLFTGVGYDLLNAQKESVDGFEFEGTIRPVAPLLLSQSLTYLRPKYDVFTNSTFGDVSGATPAGIPPLAFTAGASWDQPFGAGNHLVLRGDWHYESSVQVEDGLPAEIVTNPITGAVVNTQPAIAAARAFRRTVSEFDASVTWHFASGLELSVWGRNLTDDRYLTVVFDSPAQPGSVSAYTNEPRMYGVSALYKF
ncbi:MAG: TonB-dependent receptor [Sphingomonadales bacterium]|nr:TonB-dependent receptor [Sphingomonadales bacterium]